MPQAALIPAVEAVGEVGGGTAAAEGGTAAAEGGGGGMLSKVAAMGNKSGPMLMLSALTGGNNKQPKPSPAENVQSVSNNLNPVQFSSF